MLSGLPFVKFNCFEGEGRKRPNHFSSFLSIYYILNEHTLIVCEI